MSDDPATLDDRLVAFVRAQVESGRFASASDVIGAGLRLLEERQARVQRHAAWLREGEVTGERSSQDTPSEEIAALAQQEQTEARRSALQQALREGLESGPAQPFEFEAFLAAKRAARSRNA